MRDLQILCDASGCRRGIVAAANATDFGSPCEVCGGRGSLSLETLCTRIGENDSTVRRLFSSRARMRPAVASRICGKLVSLTERPEQGAASR